MDINEETITAQIETWNREKHQLVANINMLEGAIRSYQALLAQQNDEQDNAIVEDDGNERVG